MSKLGISTGIAPNDGFGDSLLDGAIKINNNFDEIYSAIGDGTNITNTIQYAGYATTAGIATYAPSSGISTYATTAGISTSVIGGISSVTQLSVSGVSTFSGDVRVGVDTSIGIILTSPNSTQYRLIIDDSGTLSTTAV